MCLLGVVMRHWPFFTLLLALALGAVLRIAPLNDRDYWYDEAFSGITIRQPWSEMMYIIAHDVHPPLYYWLLRSWAFVVGDGPDELRAFSVAFGLATIVLAYAALRKWESKSAIPAVVGAFVVAINPFLVNYSQEARMYSLLAFLILLAAYLLTQNRRWIYSLALLAILLTHHLGALCVLCLAVWDIFRHKFNRRWLVSGYFIPIIGFASWLPSILAQRLLTDELSWVPEVSIARIPTTLAIFLFGSPIGIAGIPPALGFRFDWLRIEDLSFLSLVIIELVVVFVVIKKRWTSHLTLTGLLAFVPALLVLILQLFDERFYVERYFIGSGLFLLLFLALALHRIHSRALVGAFAVYVLLVTLVKPWNHPTAFQNLQKFDLPDTVVFTSASDFTVGRYYLGEDVDTQLFNLPNVHESFDSWTMIRGHQVFDLPTSDHVIVTSTPEVFAGLYQEIYFVDGLSVLEPL